MKNIFPICCFFLIQFMYQETFCQDLLVIKDTLGETITTFRPGKRFHFMTQQNQEYQKGRILELTDSSVIFFLPDIEIPEEKEILIKDIILIEKASSFHYVLYGIGTAFLLNGAYFLVQAPSVTQSGILNRSIGGVSFAIGLIPFLREPKLYEFGKDYFLETTLEEEETDETY